MGDCQSLRAEGVLPLVELGESRLGLQIAADDQLDLDLDVERQGGNVINIRFRDRSVIVVNSQPPLHEIWVAAKAGGFHYRWAGTTSSPLWIDYKTGKELLSDLTQFISAQAGQAVTLGRHQP